MGVALRLQTTTSTSNVHIVVNSDSVKLKQDTEVALVEFGQFPQFLDKML